MKKVIIFLLLLTLVCGFAAAEGLNDYASYLKEGIPAAYESIKLRAESKWGEDYVMVLYEINQQSKSLMDLFTDYAEFPEDILNASIKWCDGGMEIYKSYHDKSDTLSAPINWSMVYYEVDQQVKAKSQY